MVDLCLLLLFWWSAFQTLWLNGSTHSGVAFHHFWSVYYDGTLVSWLKMVQVFFLWWMNATWCLLYFSLSCMLLVFVNNFNFVKVHLIFRLGLCVAWTISLIGTRHKTYFGQLLFRFWHFLIIEYIYFWWNWTFNRVTDSHSGLNHWSFSLWSWWSKTRFESRCFLLLFALQLICSFEHSSKLRVNCVLGVWIWLLFLLL